MFRRSFFCGLAAMAGALVAARQLAAAPKTYKYKCPKCKLIQEYGTPGTKKCPNDGTTMTRQYYYGEHPIVDVFYPAAAA